jgi:hypothetical protein
MAADDDDEIPTDPEVDLEEEPGDLDAEPEEPDADELDEEDVGFVEIDEDDGEAAEEPEDEEDEEADGDAEATTTRTRRRAAGEEEEDEDDELLSPDDVEADLDRILKDRLVTADDDDDDDEDDEPDDRVDGGDRLQPKRADEQLCPNCFLLVRATAPGCPVGDDSCPIFG